MKLGIYGGSFDPIHYGHLIVAQTACEAASLDKVLFVPAANSPLKPDGPVANHRQRTEMIKLAIGGNPRFELSSIELDRDGISYTVDTLQVLKAQHPDDQMFLIMGADSLVDFSKWKHPDQICKLAVPLLAARRGSDVSLDDFSRFVSDQRLQTIRQYAFEFPWIEISSTELRHRCSLGQSIRYRTPRAVECYVQQAKIYQRESSES